MKLHLLPSGIFLTAQLALWIAASSENIDAGSEVLVLTVALAPLVLLSRIQAVKWIAVALLTLLLLPVGFMTFEGFGLSFLGISLLYGAVVLIMIRRTKDSPEVLPSAESRKLAGNPFEFPKPPVPDGFLSGTEVYRYPLIVRRYKSMLIDAMLLFAIMIIAMVIMGENEARPAVMIALAAVLLLGYEPLLTVYSATVGQRLMSIRVRRSENPAERITLFHAYVRMIVKYIVGCISFITVHYNAQHRALHDLAVDSVVIVVDGTDSPDGDLRVAQR
jgi:hypothetical protein